MQVDHLVVVADTLEQGARWCEARLGVAPQPGGRHAFMGTHNRLLHIAGEASPRAYLEIIAIDPAAPPPGRPRWFGMDDPGLQARVRSEPCLVHWVLACEHIDRQRDAWAHAGSDPGELLDAERDTAQGLLRWRITVRPDGRPQHRGALPTLIQWQGELHPSRQLPPRGLRLGALTVRGVPASLHAGISVPGVSWEDTPGPALSVLLDTPAGPVRIESPV